jgi:hypothetical protein
MSNACCLGAMDHQVHDGSQTIAIPNHHPGYYYVVACGECDSRIPQGHEHDVVLSTTQHYLLGFSRCECWTEHWRPTSSSMWMATTIIWETHNKKCGLLQGDELLASLHLPWGSRCYTTCKWCKASNTPGAWAGAVLY